MSEPVSKKKHALIRICRTILGTDAVITYKHVNQLRSIMYEHLYNEMLSPTEIKNKYNIIYSDFGMFLKTALGLKLLSVKDAVNNYKMKSGEAVTDDKKMYQYACRFQFDPYAYSNIPGYDLLKTKGIYHAVHNPHGATRDHMMSVEYGWRNNVSAEIISHPANCQFITNSDNLVKGSGCIIDINTLTERINNWGNESKLILTEHRRLPKTAEHRAKLSQANTKLMNITNGVINKRIHKDESIPRGFWRGMIRHKK